MPYKPNADYMLPEKALLQLAILAFKDKAAMQSKEAERGARACWEQISKSDKPES